MAKTPEITLGKIDVLFALYTCGTSLPFGLSCGLLFRWSAAQLLAWGCAGAWRSSCHAGAGNGAAALHRELVLLGGPALFLLCRAGALRPRRGRGGCRGRIPAVPGFGGGRSPGTACSCCAGLRAGRSCPGQFGRWRLRRSCCAGVGGGAAAFHRGPVLPGDPALFLLYRAGALHP